MRLIPLLLIAPLLLPGASGAFAQDSPAEPGEALPAAAPAVDVDQLHDGLRALKATMEQALNTRDLDALLANVDENVVFTTMNSDVVVGREGVASYFRKMLEGPDAVVESVTTEFVPEALSFLHGGDTAVSWGHTKDHYVLKSGPELDISARWSATMVHRDGRWLVANFHYSTNMFDNPVLTAQRKTLVIAGIVAALVAVAVGFVIGRRSGGRAA